MWYAPQADWLNPSTLKGLFRIGDVFFAVFFEEGLGSQRLTNMTADDDDQNVLEFPCFPTN